MTNKSELVGGYQARRKATDGARVGPQEAAEYLRGELKRKITDCEEDLLLIEEEIERLERARQHCLAKLKGLHEDHQVLEQNPV